VGGRHKVYRSQTMKEYFSKVIDVYKLTLSSTGGEMERRSATPFSPITHFSSSLFQ